VALNGRSPVHPGFLGDDRAGGVHCSSGSGDGVLVQKVP
jgi:hypothetical protein